MSTSERDLAGGLAAAALGLLAFFVLVGPTTLIPTNIAWLDFGDRAMHTLGWMFFRETPWQVPPGLSPDLGIELSSSIGLVDHATHVWRRSIRTWDVAHSIGRNANVGRRCRRIPRREEIDGERPNCDAANEDQEALPALDGRRQALTQSAFGHSRPLTFRCERAGHVHRPRRSRWVRRPW